MNIAVIKLGSRISISSSGTSGGTGEALSIIGMLVKAGASVDTYTKVLSSDDKPEGFNIYNIEDEYNNINSRNYDALVVLNGNVNYFGGADDPAQTLNYHIINNFNGRVFYILCDCNLLLKQIWPTIEKKKWASNYNRKDIEIVRDDIIYISQARFVDKVLEKAKKCGINIRKVIHYPFEKFPLLFSKELDYNDNVTYDLLYGGTFRSGKREDDMIKFYFGYPDNVNVTMFGKIEESHFTEKKISSLSKPNFEKSVLYGEYNNKMNEAAATVIIGDPIYKQWGDLAQRIYESIYAKNVVLIDSSYDFRKLVFKNPELKEFNYVNSRNDVLDRLNKLKDNDFRKHIVELQYNDTLLDDDYCNKFLKILEDN